MSMLTLSEPDAWLKSSVSTCSKEAGYLAA